MNSVPVIAKKEMSEEDVKLHFITPAILGKGWKERMTMETKVTFTDGTIVFHGSSAVRKKETAKRADYVLYIRRNYPLAVVEAKDNNHAPSDGLQQAIAYARLLNASFAYSSNGDAFVEHDFLTGQERTLAMDEFPTRSELMARLEADAANGNGLSDAEFAMIETPYYSDGSMSPRYYQCNAINNTLGAIARGEKRIFLVMATGTGKTYTAFQIVHRLLANDGRRRILYLADRNVLVDQSLVQDFQPIVKICHKVDAAVDTQSSISAYNVHFALYQQLFGDDGTQHHYKNLYAPDFFDVVIVDECHRGSADANGLWHRVLDYFAGAVHIGMTATPRDTDDSASVSYFGPPVFEYSLRQGIEDGFLAPFKAYSIRLNISDGWKPLAGQLDMFGNEIPHRVYNNCDYDRDLILQDRTDAVARKVMELHDKIDPMGKTIVFCVDTAHAARMRDAIARLVPERMKENPDYVVRITGDDPVGKDKLHYFISVNAPYPVIATTSELLSTGVDCKMVKLIVIDKMINSLSIFKQIIGRGTRIREDEGKLAFTLMDFRGVTRLFHLNPDWDGNITITPKNEDEPFEPDSPDDTQPDDAPPGGTSDPNVKQSKIFVDGNGCPVTVVDAKVYVRIGNELRVIDIIDYTRETIKGQFASLQSFIANWSEQEKRAAIAAVLEARGIDLDEMKKEARKTELDDFDFLCHLAYDAKPLTRRERAENVKKRDALNRYQGEARAVLEALLDRYADYGVDEIEGTNVLKFDPFKRHGSPVAIANKVFGGVEKYLEAIKFLESEIYREAI